MSTLADPASSGCDCSEHLAISQRSNRSQLRIVLRCIGTALLLGWLVIGTDWGRIWPVFSGAGLWWLVVAAGILLASQLASVARWSVLVRAAGLKCSRRRLLAVYFEGMFVNLCLPTTIGGDVVKVLRIGGSCEKGKATATVVADRASGLVALVVLLGVGLLLKLDDSRMGIALAVVGVGVVLTLVIGFQLTYEGSFRFIHDLSQRLPAAVRQLGVRTPWHRVFAWAVVVQALNVVAVALAARAIGVAVPLAGILVATMTASLAAALPISIAGIGIREASLPLLLAADGVPREAAIALGLAWSAIALAVGLVGSPAHFAAQRRAVRDADSITSAAAVVSPLKRAA